MVKPDKINNEDWEALMEEHEGAMLMTGFEEALIGFGRQFNKSLAIYNKEKCLKILIEEHGMDYDEAVEHFEFNIVGSYIGETTPVFITLI